jgi:adenylate cyclase
LYFWLCSFIFIILSTLRLDPRVSFFTGLVAAIEYLILAWYLLGKGDPAGVDPFFLMKAPHFSKAFILFAGGAIAAFVAHRIRGGLVSYLKSRDEKEKIANIFRQHVSPRVVEKLIQQKEEILSETRHVCVMFLDIRNFTTFSQNRHPEEVVAYLNVLFDFMIEIVNRHNGIINKFLGDGFMAVFGAPFSDGLDSVHAVRAGIEIIEKVGEYVQTGKIVPTRVGIGLHTGKVVTGNIGSILRKEYTVIGDVVNVASRIESLNKQFGTQFLISEEVKRAIEKHAGEISGKVEGVANMEALGCVAVKGRDAQAEIYKVR